MSAEGQNLQGPTFQEAVQKLEAFWAEQGCVIWQPVNVEVGAGTMNPATFLHVLGPEPWNVAYVEPSIRPDDARYGENPNRLGRHHQFQVILKPDPGNPQELYLASLEAIGIDLEAHDLRFVEDNWESPALGAWGLGWEVWLDGLEITQFTYFQQAGSLDLRPNSVEITYGIDRILMALQDVRHFKDLRWNDRVRFGDVLMAGEVQNSRYWFELADVDRLQQMYDLYEAEAMMVLDEGLPRPAHDYVLKCSHLFNILDARGTVGVTERARFFGRMRKLARRVAEAYVEERTEAEFPLGDDPHARDWVAGSNDASAGSGVSATAAAESPAAAPPASAPDSPADFVFELGVEELPVRDLDSAVTALESRIPALLEELRLTHEGLRIGATPRRLAVILSNLAARQTDVEAEVVGPPVKAAYDAEGRPTRAAEGFAKSAGVELSELTQVEQKGAMRLAALKKEAGKPAGEVLAEALPALVASLPFARSMRWNESEQLFSRPVRWIVAMHGPWVLPLSFAGLDAGSSTRGLRPRGRTQKIADAQDYAKLMKSCGIQIDPAARKAEVARQVAALAETAGGQVPDDSDLLDEVSNLVEQPRAIRGDFEAHFLELPDAVLVTVMKKHQRYFPVVDANGSLMPHFITVAGTAAIDPDAVRYGNEAVIRARFADAAYFWKQDRDKKLEDFSAGLEGLTFQADLGSMRDKVERLETLVQRIGDRIGLDDAAKAHATRAATLAKSDLCTSMVVDFTSLQGTMGREYARLSGEAEPVAQAIYEQYLPKGAGGALPQTGPGQALALADRFDSLVGLFAAGLKPKGANDPYALRRAALGINAILVEEGIGLSLSGAVDDAAAGLPIDVSDEAKAEVLEFLRRRLEVELRDRGHAPDAVSAVLAVQADDPASTEATVAALEKAVASPSWEPTLTAYARCARIVRGQDNLGSAIDPAHFEGSAERDLYAALEAATASLDTSDISAVLSALESLTPAIDTFFEDVLVMADDEAVKANRLAMVGRIARLPEDVADLSEMEGF